MKAFPAFFAWLSLEIATAYDHTLPQIDIFLRGALHLCHQSGWMSWVLYVVTVAGSVVLLLPGFLLTVGAGFLFGAWKGILLFVISETFGSCLAFGIARRFFGARMRVYLQHHPKFALVNRTFSEEGWKFIALTRMTPFFPFKLSNYFFGAADFGFRDFFWGTLIGILPFSVTLVYLGSLATDWGTLTAGTQHGHGWRRTAAGIGVLAIIGLIFIGRHAGGRLKERLRH